MPTFFYFHPCLLHELKCMTSCIFTFVGEQGEEGVCSIRPCIFSARCNQQFLHKINVKPFGTKFYNLLVASCGCAAMYRANTVQF